MDDTHSTVSATRLALLREQFNGTVPSAETGIDQHGGVYDYNPLDTTYGAEYEAYAAAEPDRPATFAEQMLALAAWFERHPDWPRPAVMSIVSRTDAEHFEHLKGAYPETVAGIGGAIGRRLDVPGPVDITATVIIGL